MCKSEKSLLALEIQNLSFSYGDRPLFRNITLNLYTGNIYGLIGQNGTGKSTLCQLITTDDTGAYTGEIKKSFPILTISQILQRTDNLDVLSYLLKDYHNYKELLHMYEQKLCESDFSSQAALLTEYGDLLEAFEQSGGEMIPLQVNKLLNQTNLSHLSNRPLSVLSGGERRLIEIIRLHLNPNHLLILDEPETHLDIYQIFALCELLKTYRGCILMVSHNRYVLDQCCSHILCLSDTSVSEWKGNYSHYRKCMLMNTVANHFYSDNIQKKAATERDMVSRIEEIASKSSDPAWGRRLRAKRKQLERTVHKDPGKTYVDFKKIQFRFQKTSFCEQERIIIWGRNGCGKSTLFKQILNSAAGLQKTKLGYLPQEVQEPENTSQTVEEYLEFHAPSGNLSEFMQMSGYLYMDTKRKFDSLSGGERTLLRLYALTQSSYDVLLLDEPTSHLDVFTQEALQTSLEAFEGTFLMITHDPYWVSLLATKIWLIDNGMLLEMDLPDFHRWLSLNTPFYNAYLDFVKKQTELQNIEHSVLNALTTDDLKKCKELLKNL